MKNILLTVLALSLYIQILKSNKLALRRPPPFPGRPTWGYSLWALWKGFKFCRVEHLAHPGTGVPYLVRYVVVGSKWFCIYIHHFVGPDWGRDLHNHPRTFLSIGLWGRYIEETPVFHAKYYPYAHELDLRAFVFPFVNYIHHTTIHRIVNPNNCWTLCIGGPVVSQWGFFDENLHYTNSDVYIRRVQNGYSKGCVVGQTGGENE